MRLVTYRKGASKPRVGAVAGEAVLDLGALAAEKLGVLANRVVGP